MIRFRLLLLVLSCAVVFFVKPSVLGASNARPRRVLILDSFGRDVAPFNTAAAAFRTTLARDLGEPVDIYEESLDMARFAEAEKEDPLVEFIENRFAGRQLDLVVPISAPAVNFAARHRERLFPNTPMVITGTDQRRLRPEYLTQNTTVVSQNVNLPAIIEDILQILPDTKNVVVVLGASSHEKFWVAETRREFQQFADRVNFTWLDDLSFEEIRKRAAALPPHSAIVFGMLVLDTAGVPYEHDQSLKSLHAVANAPIFGHFQSQFGLGIVGGRLYQDYEVGAKAARVAIRILRGEAASSIPPEFLATAAAVYDWRELRRWGISEARLPSASVVQFRQPTFWQQYKWTIIGLLALCVLEAALIDVLLRERRRRRLAQQNLEERLRFEELVAELSSTFINLPPDKVEAQIIEALGRVGSLLGFDVAALSVFTGRGTEGRVAYIWRAEGAPEIPSDLTDKDFPWSVRELLAGRDVYLPTLDLMPLAARTDRATYERYRVRSSYSIPMVAGGKVLGVLGLNTVEKEREISPELLQGQRLLGEIFANALARSAAEQSLRENEANFRRLAETTAAVPWEADGETWTFTYVGPQAVRLLGYPFERWYEKDFWVSRLHPEDRVFAVKSRLALSKSAEDFEFEYRMIGASGATVWVHDIVKCEHQEGKLARLRGFLLDISERKQAQEALEKQRAFLRQVIDIDPNFIFAKDREGRFTLVNQAVADAYGTTVDSLIGKTDADFNLNSEEVEFFHRMDLEVMGTLKERFIPEERLTDARGNVRWLQTVKRPILDSDGSANQVLGASTDITQRKETELELQRQREELAHLTRVSTMGELAASLAHELNQPLTAILSNAQAGQRFLAANPADVEELRDILKDIVQDDSRASEVIQRMRALVKKEQLAFAPLDLAGVIRDVAALVRSDAILHGVRILLELNPGLPPVLGDKVQLQQVVLNLLLNAFDAMRDCPISERRVGVHAEQDGARTVRVVVRDHGSGLDGDNLDKIFQPFYTTKRDGLGMGLSISRSIIEAHGGRLWAKNNPDRGATFCCTLPVSDDGRKKCRGSRDE